MEQNLGETETEITEVKYSEDEVKEWEKYLEQNQVKPANPIKLITAQKEEKPQPDRGESKFKIPNVETHISNVPKME